MRGLWGLSENIEDGLDMPAPEDRLCRTCRKAVWDALVQKGRTTGWELFTMRRGDRFEHFYPSTTAVGMCGSDPIVLVRLKLDDNGPYWGWLHSMHPHNRSYRGQVSMIYSSRTLVSICFTYGPEVETKRGYGEIVRLSAEFVRDAVGREGIRYE